MSITDNRKFTKHKHLDNRNRFLERHKEYIKDQVDQIASKRHLKNMDKKAKIKLDKSKSTSEPTFTYDRKLSKNTIVLPGNNKYLRRDTIRKPSGSSSGSGGSGESEDEFEFWISPQEFIEIYFSDMELPDYIKKSLVADTIWEWRRKGYTKVGIPARLSIRKTFEAAIARKIATRSSGKVPVYLDDIDLRYKRFEKEPKPVIKAVMFCLMDVSGSMGEHEKTLAKKFFVLLNLFLHKCYENVDVIFIRHTTVAEECDEKTFFHSTESGGTCISPALELANEIIDERYDPNKYNIYIAQCTDGDNFTVDTPKCEEPLEALLNKVQYFVYVQISPEGYRKYGLEALKEYSHCMVAVQKIFHNFKTGLLFDSTGVFPVLHELFKRKGMSNG
jgi:hypothetical protein